MKLIYFRNKIFKSIKELTNHLCSFFVQVTSSVKIIAFILVKIIIIIYIKFNVKLLYCVLSSGAKPLSFTTAAVLPFSPQGGDMRTTANTTTEENVQ